MVAGERLVAVVLAYADALADCAEWAYPFGVLHQHAANDSNDGRDTAEPATTTW
jgi:hypothetical protein